MTAQPCEHDTLGCGARYDHPEHTKLGDGRPCCGWPPTCHQPTAQENPMMSDSAIEQPATPTSEVRSGVHWLSEVDAIAAEDGPDRENDQLELAARIRKLVTRECARAYRAGIAEAHHPVSTHLRNQIQAAVDHARAAHTGPLSVNNTITDAVVAVLEQPR